MSNPIFNSSVSCIFSNTPTAGTYSIGSAAGSVLVMYQTGIEPTLDFLSTGIGSNQTVVVSIVNNKVNIQGTSINVAFNSDTIPLSFNVTAEL